MNDDIERTAVRLGVRAKSELELTQEAFARLRLASLEALIATTPEQTAKRERLIVTCQILDAVRGALEQIVVNGQTAETALAMSDLMRR